MPDARGRYEITIEQTSAENGEVKLIVKIDSFAIRVWRNFQKYASKHYKIVAFRPYDPQPYKSVEYKVSLVNQIQNTIKILESKITKIKGGKNES